MLELKIHVYRCTRPRIYASISNCSAFLMELGLLKKKKEKKDLVQNDVFFCFQVKYFKTL